jgi:hypothetical protein
MKRKRGLAPHNSFARRGKVRFRLISSSVLKELPPLWLRRGLVILTLVFCCLSKNGSADCSRRYHRR